MASNVQNLIFHKVALILIPPGTGNPVAAGVEGLRNKEKMIAAVREAKDWVQLALQAVKSAPDNTFQDDEAIAGEILRRLEEKRAHENLSTY